VTRLIRLATTAGFHRPRLNWHGKIGKKHSTQGQCKKSELHNRNVLLLCRKANEPLALPPFNVNSNTVAKNGPNKPSLPQAPAYKASTATALLKVEI